MLRNEYGAIQQHLEREHIPTSLCLCRMTTAEATRLAKAMRKANDARELLERLHETALTNSLPSSNRQFRNNKGGRARADFVRLD